MNRVGLFWRTIQHLTLMQLVYQVIHRLRRPAKLSLPATHVRSYFLPVSTADKSVSWRNDEFTFLNQSVQFTGDINWNYDQLGKLWTYHLNYFDFLNQPGMTLEMGLRLMRNFRRQTTELRTGLESYPTSLRITNWVQFLSRYQVLDKEINRHLSAQVALLNHRVEYHLSGNHLLENGFALLTGALYFRHKGWFRQAHRLVRRELDRQILSDGGHYERSPVYHQVLLNRLLDALLILQSETHFTDTRFLAFLQDKAVRMLHWLSAITFCNGDVPMVNDAASGLAPTTAQLQQKAATSLSVWTDRSASLSESGYRVFRHSRYELVADVGSIGPDHQPGHGHADTFSFVLHVDNCPIIVDTGTSTYQPGDRRQWERSTAAHNTVTIGDNNSSEVWATFRMGYRARTTVMTDTPTRLTARHDEYQSLGCIHERTWQVEPARLVIRDALLKTQTNDTSGTSGVARFYFHPAVPVHVLDDRIQAGPLKIDFQSATKPKFTVIRSQIADGFNRLQPGYCLAVHFITRLETILTFSE